MDGALIWKWVEGPVFTIVGFVLATLLMTRLLRDDPQPGNATAWLLGFIFLPFIAVPLYLVFGGRKFRRMSGRKRRLAVDSSKIPGVTQPLDPLGETVVQLGGFAPACGGNAVTVHTDGVEAWDELIARIEGAQRSIHFCVFIFGTDEVSQRVVDALAAKARAGVQVRVLVDALGSLRARFRLLPRLRAAGAEVAAFMPVLPLHRKWAANLRNHRKIFLFDERIAIVGGRNIENHYLGPKPDATRWLDVSMTIEGPAVGALCQVFAQDWEFADGTRLALADPVTHPVQGEAVLQTIASGPDIDGDPLHDAILAALFATRRRAWIITPYLVPDHTTLTTLRLLARTGRDVQVLIPARTDLPLVDFARRYALRELHRDGVRIWLYKPTMVHAKVMLFDDDTALVGSVNADMRSFYFNYEIGVFAYNRPAADQLSAYFNALAAESTPYTPRPRDRRWHAIGDAFLENISRLISPLL